MRARDARPERSTVSPSSGPWSANVSRTLRETLEAFASEAVTSEILLNALADGGYGAPPELADDLSEFATGPLRAEITAVLGGEVADAVIDGLGPVITMMRAAEREPRAATPPSSAPTLVPPPSPSAPASRGIRPVSRPDMLAVAPRPISHPSLPAASRGPSRPDLPSVPPARAAIPIPPSLMYGRGKEGKSTPPSRPAAAGREAPKPTHPERAASGSELIDLTVVTADEALAAAASTRFIGRRFATGASLAQLPRSRVIVLDTRHALEELRTTWPVSRAPQVVVLWPADARERALFEALQPHVPRVVCAGEEAEIGDVMMLVALQLTPA